MTEQGFVAEVEVAMLGQLLDGGEFAPVLAYLRPEHFVEPVHQVVYGAILQAQERYSTTELPTVLKLIPEQVQSDFKAATGTTLGGYLSRMLVGTFTGSPMGRARNVVEQWARLELARQTSIISEAARSADTDPLVLLRETSSLLERVGSEVRRSSSARPTARFDAAIDEMIAEAEEAIERGGPAGISTGLIDLDRMTGGLHRRDLILLGARPSMGKTSLATSAGLTAAANGHGVAIFSLEMDRPKLTARMLSDIAFRNGLKIPYQEIINSPSRHHIDQLRGAGQMFRTLPIWIDDTASINTAELRAKLEGMIATAQEGGFTIDLVVIDHLLKLSAASRYAGQRVLEIGEITASLKQVARDYDLAVLLLTQLSRAVESRDDKHPQLADLRDSGAIEQDADVVLFLYRKAYYLQRQRASAKSADDQIEIDAAISASINTAEIIVEKQRNGRVGTVETFVDMPHSHFANAVRQGYAEMHEFYRGAA